MVPRKAALIPPKVAAMRTAVSMKKGSGTILINRSVAGLRIQRSLSKKIWWKTIKYFEKFVDITAVIRSAAAKNTAMPAQRDANTCFIKSALCAGYLFRRETMRRA